MPVSVPDAVFLRAFGVPVTFTGAPAGAMGILDDSSAEMLDNDGRAEVMVAVKALLVETAVADLVTASTTITVGGTSYRLSKRPKHTDGAFTTLYLRRP
jgi:hypothetical protein